MDNPFGDKNGFIWLNGRFLPWKEAKTHVMDYGLHYGSCVFEGDRSYNGKIFALEQHTKRLHGSAALLKFSIPYSEQKINDVCREILELHKLKNAYVRPVAWRTTSEMGISIKGSKTNLAIAAWGWPEYFDKDKKNSGIALKLSTYRRPGPECAPVHAKASGLYIICTLARQEAIDCGYEDALMLEWRGQIAEATGANVFFIKDGELHTPSADCFLDGITRQNIIKLANNRKVKVHERPIMPDELADFSECFICGTAIEIMPVRQISQHNFQVGRLSLDLMQDYSALVRNGS